MGSATTSGLGFFFLQAEDGIRYHCVTGVQTCALPIYPQGGAIRVLLLVDGCHYKGDPLTIGRDTRPAKKFKLVQVFNSNGSCHCYCFPGRLQLQTDDGVSPQILKRYTTPQKSADCTSIRARLFEDRILDGQLLLP